MKIAILGAGNVALANAWYLANAGCEVHVWSALPEERAALAATGRVTAEGLFEGPARISAGEQLKAAIDGARIVMICAPAFAHGELMRLAAPFLDDRHCVLVHPVTGLSSLLLSGLIMDRPRKPVIVDVSTSLFTARKTGPTSVKVLKLKDVVEIASIPADRGDDALSLLQSLFGDRFRLEPNALSISLNNHNPVYHVPPMLCNLSRAEKRENWIIWECITPGVARLVGLLDEERLKVARHFGTPEVPVADYFRQAHGAEGGTLVEIFASVARKLKGPVGPQALDHRFITEDVPFGLVFFRDLGRSAGLEMPLTDNFISLSSALFDRDFVAEGHTLERLGLRGRSRSEIIDATQRGL